MSLFQRISLVAFAAAAILVAPLVPASAQSTGSWTDVSYLLNERQNRPVWAMAYASPYWYLTDGQELWSGGHVWKTEGSNLVDITSEIRNAGLSRVDDIVSDGQTVVYLKNVVAQNRNFEIVSYNGSYNNATYRVRENFNYNEGLTQLSGRNGVWYMVTTQGRLLRWYPTGSTSVVTLPSELRNNLQLTNMAYSMNQGFASGSTWSLGILPVSGKWIVFGKTAYNRYSMYNFDGSTFNQLSVSSDAMSNDIMAAASNGNKAIFVIGTSGSHYGYVWATEYNGSYFTENRNFMSSCNTGDYGCETGYNKISNYNDATLVSNGNNWMLIAGKHGYEINSDNKTVNDIGEMRDYFVTAAENGNGVLMFGGAASTLGRNEPSYPLTAKLVRLGGSTVTNYDGGSTTDLTTNGKSNGISFWTWLEPSKTNLRQGEVMSYNVGAWKETGLKRVELYANDSVRRTCELGRAYGNQTCAYTLSGYDYPVGTTVELKAKITGYDGKIAWTTAQKVYVTDYNGNSYYSYYPYNYNYNTYTDNSGDISVWNWFDPSGSTLTRYATTNLKVQANATNGLARVEVYADDSLKRTCELSRAYGTQTCDLSIYGNNYSNGQHSFKAKATDWNGKTAWSDVRYLTIQNDGYTDTYNSNTNGSVGLQANPNQTTFNNGTAVTFYGSASDPDGLQRIDILKDGSVVKTCTYSNVTDWQSCGYATTVYGDGNYSKTFTIAVNAYDRYGNVRGVTPTTYTVYGYNNTNNNNNNVNGNSSWIWSSPDVSTLTNGQSATFGVGAWSNYGIRKIEIMRDGMVVRTCDLNQAYGNQECTVAVDANYSGTTYLNYSARITDGNWNTFTSQSKSYTVSYNGSNTNTNTGSSAGSVTATSNLDSGYTTTDQLTVTANGSDADGIDRIEILVNAELVQTCSASTCTWTGGPFPYRSSVTYAARLVDKYGNSVTTGYKTIYKK